MNVLILMVVFIVIHRAHVSNVKNFVEINISYDNEKFKRPNLSVIHFNDANDCHDAANWVKDRQGKPWIQCEVRMNHARCFCDIQNGNCWDFEDVMEAIYSVDRDKAIASIPEDSYSHAGNGKEAIEKIKIILNTLHENALNLSEQLLNQTTSTSSYTSVAGFDKSCSVSSKPNLNESEALINRREVGLKVYPDDSYCFQFFSRFNHDLYNNQSTMILMLREKLRDQIDSNEKLYLCETLSKNTTEKKCELGKIKDKLPEKWMSFMKFTSGRGKFDSELDYSEIKNYFKWMPIDNNSSSKAQGIIVSWIFASILLVMVLVIIRSVSKYELIEERKRLDPSQFKLKDIETELKKAMSGKTPETSVMTLEASRDLEKARQLDRKRQKKHKASIFRSTQLPTPKESSDLESVKRKSNNSQFLKLQKTQNDVTEFIGTAIEAKLPPVPKHARPPAEKSLPSRTDQGTFVNKGKSDDNIVMKSIQKTQSLSEPEVIEMPTFPPPPAQPPILPPPPPPPILPKIPRSSRHKSPRQLESKRVKRKKPKSRSRSETPTKISRKKSRADQSPKNQSPKENKKHFLSFWS
ncbi:hypothetical protein B9Z55_002141 [Caenorhabditis nigoni]|uniref:Uncharacterized protein n=2 Tax=Caenorhabditis nigoni TaxID=1611254 RepID=A0A2G5VJB2_9PELO|nr:hypothetical protein B9Z55_002141 [Caenorhabditis nigoni]